MSEEHDLTQISTEDLQELLDDLIHDKQLLGFSEINYSTGNQILAINAAIQEITDTLKVRGLFKDLPVSIRIVEEQ